MIDYITAHNGGIKMFAGDGLKGWSKTAKGIAYTPVSYTHLRAHETG